ncbi:hypothetical protein V6N13_041484 [Hibiscus sabdariffa]|uniref:Uncharacterized protein n=1 Tax=Hibiscus sabdariffa TaxID=183260 RepID=A0ABR2RBS2_9ROSI
MPQECRDPPLHASRCLRSNLVAKKCITINFHKKMTSPIKFSRVDDTKTSRPSVACIEIPSLRIGKLSIIVSLRALRLEIPRHMSGTEIPSFQHL